MSSTTIVRAVKAVLSAPRMGTYEVAAGQGPEHPASLELYAWNAQISAAFLAPLHICEVAIRNAVSDAIEAQHGHRWPWAQGFERSLPSPPMSYNPRRDLQNSRRSAHTTGQVIPELKFVFWQKMFTRRFDQRIWSKSIFNVFPNLDKSKTVRQARNHIYSELDSIRHLRNRIAHHEPIFNRNLEDDFDKIKDLIWLRCRETSAWMERNQHAVQLLKEKPVP